MSDIPKKLQALVWGRDGGQCCYCRLFQSGQASRFHVDHIQPKTAGGKTELSNLILACPRCNLRKGSQLCGRDPTGGQEVRLFHPLQDSWDMHFMLRADGHCHGISSIGRATVAALDMNGVDLVSARLLQMVLGVLSPTEHHHN